MQPEHIEEGRCVNNPTPAAAPSTALVASLATEGGAMTVAQLKANRELMKQAMADLMEPGRHYGKIQGTQKPCLFKPGAELLCVLFRVNAEPIVEDLSDDDCIRYRVKMKGIHTPSGQVVAWGVGECSTDEDKYKWREAKCKAEYTETADDRRRWKWKGEGDDNGVNQVRTNPADAANTILKMAEKRAKCDLALAFSACSDVFNQDLDDIAEWLRERVADDEEGGGDLPAHGKAGTKAPQKRVTPAAGTAQTDPARKINEAQLSVLKSQMDHSGVSEKTILEKYGVDRLEDLPFSNLNAAMQYCRNINAEPR
jgi:hypothetical protein